MASEDPQAHVTVLLRAAGQGDRSAAADLLPLVYEQLRRAAQRQMGAERNGGAGHTLSATALVHEVYLKLLGPHEVPWEGRGHFYAAAAESMRRLLIDRARSKHGRDGGRGRREALRIAGLQSVLIDENPDGLLALDDALGRLESADPQAATVVRLRFFAGLEIEQAAAALGVSARTVKRAWAFARAWLREDLERQEDVPER
ncbi:MAG: ECF-type sigma factor [Phycisphaerales bacterium]